MQKCEGMKLFGAPPSPTIESPVGSPNERSGSFSFKSRFFHNYMSNQSNKKECK